MFSSFVVCIFFLQAHSLSKLNCNLVYCLFPFHSFLIFHTIWGCFFNFPPTSVFVETPSLERLSLHLKSHALIFIIFPNFYVLILWYPAATMSTILTPFSPFELPSVFYLSIYLYWEHYFAFLVLALTVDDGVPLLSTFCFKFLAQKSSTEVKHRSQWIFLSNFFVAFPVLISC